MAAAEAAGRFTGERAVRRRNRRALVSVVVGAAVFLAGWLGGAGTARASSGRWWLPTAWTSTASGSLDDVRSIMSGGTLSLGGTPGITQGALPGVQSGNPAFFGWELVEVNLSGGLWVFHRAYCNPGTSNSTGCDSAPAEGTVITARSFIGTVTCAAGTRDSQVVTVTAGVPAGPSYCGSSPVTSFVAPVTSSGAWQWIIRGFTYTSGAADVYTTTITCRSLSTGADTTQTESAAGSAPSPVCPAGTVLVRAQVWRGSTLLQDSSITSAALSQYGGYLGDPGGWTWHDDGGDNCHIQNSADPTMVIVLSVDVCHEANQGGVTQSEQVQDCGSDIVCSAIQQGTSTISRILTGIASTVGQLLTGVGRIISAISGVVQGIIDGVRGFVDQVIAAINAVRDLLQAILDTLSGPGPTGPGNLDGGGGPGLPGGPDPGTLPQVLKDKFGPLIDFWGDMASAFNPPAGSCAGPSLHLPSQLGGQTVHPFDACTEPMATMALWTKRIGTALLVVGSLLLTWRVLSSSLSLGVDVGKGGSSDV